MSLQMLGPLSCATLKESLVRAQHAVQAPSLEGPCQFVPMSSYGIFLQGNQQYSSFLGFNKRIFPWELVAAALNGSKDRQVVYLLVPSGNCLQSPFLQSISKVYPVPEGYAQHNTA